MRLGAGAKHRGGAASYQNSSLILAWNTRGVSAPVDRPKLLLLKSATGLFRFTRLNALNASKRNCAASRSRILKVLASDRSVSAKPGPRNTLRPRLPSVPGTGAGKTDA